MPRKRVFTVAAICLPALVAIAGGLSQSANAALVAYYPLNGTTDNLVDPTNNGVVHGTTQYTTDQNGNPNGAFAFDGTTYISANASSFPTADRTVFLWFNAETVATDPYFWAMAEEPVVPRSLLASMAAVSVITTSRLIVM